MMPCISERNSAVGIGPLAWRKASKRATCLSAASLATGLCGVPGLTISAARIGRLYYGAADPKSGGVAVGARVFSHPQCHHVPEVYDGIGAAEAERLLKAFFAAKR